MEYLIHYAITVLAVLSVSYIHALLFTVTKADKYEDMLADKVAKRVEETLRR